MLQDTRRTRGVVGASAGSILAIALAVVVGAIPVQAQVTGPPTAAAAAFDDPTPLPDAGAAEVPPEVVAGPVDEAPASPGPQPEAEPAAPSEPHPAPTHQAPVADEPPPPPSAAASVQGAPLAPVPAPPPPPAADATVSRRQPPPAEVQQALDGLEPYVDSVFSPSAAQVAEAGDKVCTAFDEGQTFAQVKATARELVSQVPLTTVRPGADDYVVRTVVALYCPGHQPKLV